MLLFPSVAAAAAACCAAKQIGRGSRGGLGSKGGKVRGGRGVRGGVRKQWYAGGEIRWWWMSPLRRAERRRAMRKRAVQLRNEGKA